MVAAAQRARGQAASAFRQRRQHQPRHREHQRRHAGDPARGGIFFPPTRHGEQRGRDQFGRPRIGIGPRERRARPPRPPPIAKRTRRPARRPGSTTRHSRGTINQMRPRPQKRCARSARSRRDNRACGGAGISGRKPAQESEKSPGSSRFSNPSGLPDKTRSRFLLMPFRLRPKFSGLFQDEIALDSFWIRERRPAGFALFGRHQPADDHGRNPAGTRKRPHGRRPARAGGEVRRSHRCPTGGAAGRAVPARCAGHARSGLDRAHAFPSRHGCNGEQSSRLGGPGYRAGIPASLAPAGAQPPPAHPSDRSGR